MMRSIIAVVLVAALVNLVAAGGSSARCPSALSPIWKRTFTLKNDQPGMSIDVIICGSLPNGCPGTGCVSSGCCSVCQRWTGDQPGAACIGNTLSQVNSSGQTIQLLYIGGDPVVDPNNPSSNGPRQVRVTLSCGSSPLGGQVTFVDPGTLPNAPNHVAGTPWTYQVKAQSQYSCGACGHKKDCGSCLTRPTPGKGNTTGCVWCLDNGSSQGFCGPHQMCRNFVSKQPLCPPEACSLQKTCGSCTGVKSTSCAWCLNDQNKGACIPAGKAGAQCSGIFRDPNICPS